MSVWYYPNDPCIALFSASAFNNEYILGTLEGFSNGNAFNILCTPKDLRLNGWTYIGEFE